MQKCTSFFRFPFLSKFLSRFISLVNEKAVDLVFPNHPWKHPITNIVMVSARYEMNTLAF